MKIQASDEDRARLAELRELLLSAEDSQATRVLVISLALLLLGTVLWLVRRRVLREEYTPIWVTVSVLMVIVSLRLDVMRSITRAIGAWTVSSTLFFLGELFLIGIALTYAVRLSKHGAQLKVLAQESAILRSRLDELEAQRASSTRAPTET